jgi:5-methylcytosine-specific restriction endonuclease McrA
MKPAEQAFVERSRQARLHPFSFDTLYLTSLKQFRPDADPERYLAWRKAVLARSGGFCALCLRGKTIGKKRYGSVPIRLDADHIKPWSQYPALRYEVSNGRALCRSCHDVVHEADRRKHWMVDRPDPLRASRVCDAEDCARLALGSETRRQTIQDTQTRALTVGGRPE